MTAQVHCFGDETKSHEWQPLGFTVDAHCGGLVPTDICDTCGAIRQNHPAKEPHITTLAHPDGGVWRRGAER